MTGEKTRRSAWRLILCSILCASATIRAQDSRQPDWVRLEDETMRHFQALLRLDTSNPPGNEVAVTNYLKQVLEKEGIPVQVFAREPNRPNLVARLKGNGRKQPILFMGHTDVVTVDPLFSNLIQPNSAITRLWTGALWAEGPAWCAQGQYLVWSDIPNNRQLRFLETVMALEVRQRPVAPVRVDEVRQPFSFAELYRFRKRTLLGDLSRCSIFERT